MAASGKNLPAMRMTLFINNFMKTKNIEYKKYLKSEDWNAKRYFKRLNKNNCAICNSKENLHVHHLNYKNLIDVKMSDLRVLCKRCHFLAHKLYNEGKIKFKNNNHLSRFQILKLAVKKELGISKINLFNKKI